MSPAPVVADTQQDLQLQTLARAFEALLLTTQELGSKERRLQQRLEYANTEVTFSSPSLYPPPSPVSYDEKNRLALDQESHLRR